MANTIKIKRSAITSSPTTLADGELAYSSLSGNLFIGTNGGADITLIGGYTDHAKLAGIQAGAQVNTVTSVAGKTGAVTLTLSDITDYSDSNYVKTSGAQTISGNKTFSNDVVINGNLDVNGTVTTIDSTNLSISDNIIELNKGATGPTLDAGISVYRGAVDDAAKLIWDETSDKWVTQLGTGSKTAISLSGHTHTASDITDFSTSVQSIVNSSIGSITLDNLNDVIITTPTANQILKFNGTNWVNGTNPTGVTTFLELSDTPSVYTGSANYFVKVNTGATALEFIADPGYLANTSTIDCGTF